MLLLIRWSRYVFGNVYNVYELMCRSVGHEFMSWCMTKCFQRDRSEKLSTPRPSVLPTESSKNNTVFAILGGIGGAAMVILLIAIIILQCVYLRRRRKRINYPVWESKNLNDTLHTYIHNYVDCVCNYICRQCVYALYESLSLYNS